MPEQIEQFQYIPIKKLVWKLGIPAMLAQFLNVFYSIVDRFFVGQIEGSGELALAAIGVSAPAITAISAFAFMVGIGGASIMSMKLGEGDSDSAQEALNSGALLLIFFSIVVTIAAITFRRPLLFLLGCSEKMYPLAQEYFSVCAAGTMAVLIGGGLNHYIMAQGMAKQAMLTLSFGAIVNIFLGDIYIDPARQEARICGQPISLRHREFSLLLYFMRNPGIVLSAGQICENAWGMEYTQPIDRAIHELRKQIESNPRQPRYIQTVYRVGYRFTAYSGETCER